MEWPEQTIRDLRTLWAQGHSTAEIGRRLGVSKNSVVGKAHRLDLEARPSPIRRAAGYVKPPPSIPHVARVTLPPLASYEPPEPQSAQVWQDCIANQIAAIWKRPEPAPVQPRVVAPRPPAPAPIVFRPRPEPCCWPIGEPKSKTFRFCFDPAPGGKPYCDEHSKLAYVRIRDRRDDVAA